MKRRETKYKEQQDQVSNDVMSREALAATQKSDEQELQRRGGNYEHFQHQVYVTEWWQACSSFKTNNTSNYYVPQGCEAGE